MICEIEHVLIFSTVYRIDGIVKYKIFERMFGCLLNKRDGEHEINMYSSVEYYFLTLRNTKNSYV